MASDFALDFALALGRAPVFATFVAIASLAFIAIDRPSL
jgi:hypothetical protein